MNQENYYKTYYLADETYSCLVICLSYASLYNYLDKICAELNANGISNAQLLLDQLLITGNKHNRFLSIELSNGHIIPQSAKNVDRIDAKYRTITSMELRKRKTILHNSILSKTEIQLIEDGIVI